MKYRSLFFDLDHTLWDFETNSRLALNELYQNMELKAKGSTVLTNSIRITCYIMTNYGNATAMVLLRLTSLRWKRMWLSLLDFKIGDQTLAREMGNRFLEILPTRKTLFPYTVEILEYLTQKDTGCTSLPTDSNQRSTGSCKRPAWTKYFIEVITSEGSNSLKPHKEIFDYALKRQRPCRRKAS